MVTTDDPQLWSRMWSYKDHGKSWDAVYNRQHPAGFRWLHESFGTNYRMLEIQAVIGRIQLRRLPAWSLTRAANAGRLAAACSRYAALRAPAVPHGMKHAWYRFYAFVRPESLVHGWTRDRIAHEINGLGVPCFHGSCSEVYLERAFEGSRGRPAAILPAARELGETSLMFLVHPTLTRDEIERTCTAIESILSQASAERDR